MPIGSSFENAMEAAGIDTGREKSPVKNNGREGGQDIPGKREIPGYELEAAALFESVVGRERALQILEDQLNAPYGKDRRRAAIEAEIRGIVGDEDECEKIIGRLRWTLLKEGGSAKNYDKILENIEWAIRAGETSKIADESGKEMDPWTTGKALEEYGRTKDAALLEARLAEIREREGVEELPPIGQAIAEIISGFEVENDVVKFMEKLEKLYQDRREEINDDTWRDMPYRVQAMWWHIGEKVTFSNGHVFEVRATWLKSAPPEEWLEKQNDIQTLGNIAMNGCLEARIAVKEKIIQLLLPLAEHQVFSCGYVFTKDGGVFDSGSGNHFPSRGTIEETKPNKNGWFELKDGKYANWRRPSEFNDIPESPATAEWSDKRFQEALKEKEKVEQSGDRFNPFAEGIFWPNLKFEEGTKGWEHPIPRYGKIVPRKGWTPKYGVKYNIVLTRRIDNPQKSENNQYRGVWTCEPVDASGDEKLFDDWAKMQEKAGRFRVRYIYEQNVESVVGYHMEIMATGEFITVSVDDMEKILNPDQHFIKDKRYHGYNKFSHEGSGILDKEIIDKIRAAGKEYEARHKDDNE